MDIDVDGRNKSRSLTRVDRKDDKRAQRLWYAMTVQLNLTKQSRPAVAASLVDGLSIPGECVFQTGSSPGYVRDEFSYDWIQFMANPSYKRQTLVFILIGNCGKHPSKTSFDHLPSEFESSWIHVSALVVEFALYMAQRKQNSTRHRHQLGRVLAISEGPPPVSFETLPNPTRVQRDFNQFKQDPLNPRRCLLDNRSDQKPR